MQKYNLEFLQSLKSLKTLKIIIPIFFLFSGYVYETSLLNSFGISLDGYFSISDYLVSCLNQTINLLLSFLPGIFISWVFIKPASPAERTAERNRKMMKIFLLSSMLAFSALMLYYFFLNKLPWKLIPSICGIAIIFLYFELITVKNFNIIFLLTVYISIISFAAVNTKNEIIHQQPNSLINFSKTENLPKGLYSIITSNSQYFFIYDNKHERTLIIPVEDISYINYKNSNKIIKIMSSKSTKRK